MALFSTAASHAVDAMEHQMSPASQNSITDKVFHTDIRITSVEDAPKDAVPASQSSSRLTGSSQDAEAVEIGKRDEEMQEWWDDAILRNMNLPEGYEDVAVLIIKWDDELDELKTREEAAELDAVFRTSYHYHTETVELNVSSKPQHQLSLHLAAFVEKHDGPNNLMIVYYTGHGVYPARESAANYLALTGSLHPTVKRGFQNEARANWNKAEEALMSDDIEGDVLTILDTCYSSNLQKSGKEDNRAFELLSACAYDMTTAAPGPRSFTRALIDALKEYVREGPDRSFTTHQLNQRVLMNPNRRDTPSQLWSRRLHQGRHIRLAPLKPEKDRLRAPSFPPPPRGYLTLRFALRHESLNREQIDHLTRKLSQAFNSKLLTGLRRIEWLGMKPARRTHLDRAASAMAAAKQWKKVVRKNRETRRRAARRVDDVKLPVETSTDSTSSSPTRKRSRGEDESLPDAKRELLVPNPPSPPISDISRMDDAVE